LPTAASGTLPAIINLPMRWDEEPALFAALSSGSQHTEELCLEKNYNDSNKTVVVTAVQKDSDTSDFELINLNKIKGGSSDAEKDFQDNGDQSTTKQTVLPKGPREPSSRTTSTTTENFTETTREKKETGTTINITPSTSTSRTVLFTDSSDITDFTGPMTRMMSMLPSSDTGEATSAMPDTTKPDTEEIHFPVAPATSVNGRLSPLIRPPLHSRSAAARSLSPSSGASRTQTSETLQLLNLDDR
jgi:hypothetical protein